MLTRGIVEEIIDDYRVRVRMPVYNKVKSAPLHTPTSELNIATICSLPNFHINLRIGDIVFLGFEDNDLGKPVILGYLNGPFKISSKCDIDVSSLTADVKSRLPADTTIGKVTAQNILQLQGATNNLQDQIQQLNNNLVQRSGVMEVLVSDWEDLSFSFINSFLSVNDLILFFPFSSSDAQQISDHSVVGSNSGPTVTFTASSLPTDDIKFAYMVVKGR